MFTDFPEQSRVTQLLQRSIERNRLAHAYLFTGGSLDELEGVARTLAKTLNCQNPTRRGENGMPLDCCDACDSCRRIEELNHPDISWVRPESKSRIITIDQMRDLMQTVNLKATAAEYKVGIIVAADRLNIQAANAFLKTLEEPPPKSTLILLTTESSRLLETIISRCLRLNFAGEAAHFSKDQVAWLSAFGDMAAKADRNLLARYRLLGLIMKRLTEQKEIIEKALTARSPLERYDDLDPKMREKLEDELTAAVESEYRRQRAELISALQWWLRDVWLQTLVGGADMLCFPDLLATAKTIAQRISTTDALENIQHMDRLLRQLNSNVQEALALEVGLLKLKL